MSSIARVKRKSSIFPDRLNATAEKREEIFDNTNKYQGQLGV